MAERGGGKRERKEDMHGRNSVVLTDFDPDKFSFFLPSFFYVSSLLGLDGVGVGMGGFSRKVFTFDNSVVLNLPLNRLGQAGLIKPRVENRRVSCVIRGR